MSTDQKATTYYAVKYLNEDRKISLDDEFSAKQLSGQYVIFSTLRHALLYSHKFNAATIDGIDGLLQPPVHIIYDTATDNFLNNMQNKKKIDLNKHTSSAMPGFYYSLHGSREAIECSLIDCKSLPSWKSIVIRPKDKYKLCSLWQMNHTVDGFKEFLIRATMHNATALTALILFEINKYRDQLLMKMRESFSSEEQKTQIKMKVNILDSYIAIMNDDKMDDNTKFFKFAAAVNHKENRNVISANIPADSNGQRFLQILTWIITFGYYQVVNPDASGCINTFNALLTAQPLKNYRSIKPR